MTTFTVNNVEIKTSTRGVTGYEGSTFSPAWTLDMNKPFIAAIGNPTEAKLVKLLRAPERTALHLGIYADSREAAYVVALYRANPEQILAEHYATGHVDVDFPSELYNLPEYMTNAEAQKLIAETRATRKETGTKKRIPSRPVVDMRMAADCWAELYKKHNLKALADKYGRDEIVRAREVLTVNELELRYGL